MPENPESFKYDGLELVDEIKRRKAEEEQRRLEMQEKMNQPRQRQFQMPPGASAGSANRSRG